MELIFKSKPVEPKPLGPFNACCLRLAMEADGIAPYKLARACKVSRETVIGWMAREGEPTEDQLAAIVAFIGKHTPAFYYQDIQPWDHDVYICGPGGCHVHNPAKHFGTHPDTAETQQIIDELDLTTLPLSAVRRIRKAILSAGSYDIYEPAEV